MQGRELSGNVKGEHGLFLFVVMFIFLSNKGYVKIKGLFLHALWNKGLHLNFFLS